MRLAARCLALLLLSPAIPAWGADNHAAQLDRLQADILASPSATQLLTARCAELHLADPAVVHAETVKTPDAVTAEVRALLQVSDAEPLRHRHVRLTCGGHVLSEADNWYVPARLTPAMNDSLDHSDTPFGTVVRPLDFHRRTVEAVRPPSGPVLQVKAVLLTPQETPISVVIENYTGELLAPP
jgi:chorismate-pyruvate lyase